jgi:uncharacterized membrane protein
MVKIRRLTIQKTLPWILIVTAVIGFGASFTLVMEHIHLLKNPDYQLNCNINPILSCGPVMESKTATQFGFPNPLIGLAFFSAQAMLGLIMLAGAKMKSWFWKLWGVAILGSLGFVFWLMSESLLELKAICIYCLISWIVTFISSWYVFQYMLADKHISLPNKSLQIFIRRYHLEILITWFLLVAGLIVYEFWYFFGPKLGF